MLRIQIYNTFAPGDFHKSGVPCSLRALRIQIYWRRWHSVKTWSWKRKL